MDGPDRGRSVDLHVVLALAVLESPVRELPSHADPELDLAPDQILAAQGAGRVGWRVEQTLQVGEEANRDDHHAPVGLAGQHLPIEKGGVGGVAAPREAVGEGLRHRFRVLRLGGFAGVSRVAHLEPALVADRDVRPAIPGVDRVQAGPDVLVARGDARGQDLRLPQVGERVQRGQGAHVVHVRGHVRVEDDLDRRLRGRGASDQEEHSGEQRGDNRALHGNGRDHRRPPGSGQCLDPGPSSRPTPLPSFPRFP